MKALALFSGGLDSTLAIKVILEQGIEVIALNFMSPFCCCDKGTGCASTVKSMADILGVEFKRIYLGQDYLDMIKNPKYGYGKNLNPCIDCRIFKFKYAKNIMKEVGASFVISGEVLGQRPMSQHRQALKIIEKEAGLEELLLRPLSAKLFPQTLPENKGWVNRDKLLAISGRTRKPQIKLASGFGIEDYPCPAGGCLLTDKTFIGRLKDLFEFDKINDNNARLLRLGRHFRINSKFKLIVGRNEKENSKIFSLAKSEDIILEPKELPGPTAIGRGAINKEVKDCAARIIARYTSLNGERVKVSIKSLNDSNEEFLFVSRIDEENIRKLIIK